MLLNSWPGYNGRTWAKLVSDRQVVLFIGGPKGVLNQSPFGINMVIKNFNIIKKKKPLTP